MNSIFSQYSEKRDYIRMDVETKISFSLPNNSEIIRGKTINLSAKGLAFTTDMALNPGMIFPVAIHAGHHSVPSLESRFEVLRVVAPNDHQRDFVISGRFSETH